LKLRRFERIKSYYNDITRDNLQLIRSLKDDIHEMRQKEKVPTSDWMHAVNYLASLFFCGGLYRLFESFSDLPRKRSPLISVGSLAAISSPEHSNFPAARPENIANLGNTSFLRAVELLTMCDQSAYVRRLRRTRRRCTNSHWRTRICRNRWPSAKNSERS